MEMLEFLFAGELVCCDEAVGHVNSGLLPQQPSARLLFCTTTVALDLQIFPSFSLETNV
jgi:hypothetical protein